MCHGDQTIMFLLCPLINGQWGIECHGVVKGCFVSDIEGDCGVILDTDNGGSYGFKRLPDGKVDTVHIDGKKVDVLYGVLLE